MGWGGFERPISTWRCDCRNLEQPTANWSKPTQSAHGQSSLQNAMLGFMLGFMLGHVGFQACLPPLHTDSHRCLVMHAEIHTTSASEVNPPSPQTQHRTPQMFLRGPSYRTPTLQISKSYWGSETPQPIYEATF